jgi:hypothetical protein
MSAFVMQSIVKTSVSAEGHSRRFVALPITSGLARTADMSLHRAK